MSLFQFFAIQNSSEEILSASSIKLNEHKISNFIQIILTKYRSINTDDFAKLASKPSLDQPITCKVHTIKAASFEHNSRHSNSY